MERASGPARIVSGRWTKWIVLVVWIVLGFGVAGQLSAKFPDVQQNDQAQWLPSGAEATQVVELQEKFNTADIAAAVIVYERPDGVSSADESKAAADAGRLAGVDGVTGSVIGPLKSADGKAIQVIVPVKMGSDGFTKAPDRVKAMKEIVEANRNGLNVYVSGQVGVAGDNVSSFSGTDQALLLTTVVVVIIILLFAYRSPFAWILPVISALVALNVTQAFIYLLAKNAGLTVNGQSAGILTVLVFGASTDYALLLIARYREELRRHADRHQAMAIALHRAGPAMLASAGTVAVGMLCLMVADMNSTKGLGPVCAIGIGMGFLSMITLLPALLVIFGRWIFWPVKPKVGTEEKSATGGLWSRLGRGIAGKPRTVWVATAAALAICALGLTQLNATGLSVTDSFVDKPQAIVGAEVAAKHFPGGEGQPVVVIGKASASEALTTAIRGTDGIAEVGPPLVAGDLVMLQGVLKDLPDTSAAEATVLRVRDAVHAVAGADAKVGGPTASTIDMNKANRHDNMLVIPLVLAAVLLILGLLLRAVVAPLLLIATVVLSYAAALGISAVVFKGVFGFDSSDSSFPLMAFVFLVALGIDYNIFLMTRVREEAQVVGTRRGMLTGLATTGGVITSAGLVLAATFAVLANLPLVFFAELGFAVALGVLLDALIVRSVLVTALNLDFGKRIWWPSPLAAKDDDPEPDAIADAPERPVVPA
ncbi:MMPL family transporter [Dactylosporangium sp. CS-033363]|uniref:MMPL family transporter n=1 Tax=Dactylosporangium sp. CS-033363 TaxID=3239935 RepID=UPI003D928296